MESALERRESHAFGMGVEDRHKSDVKIGVELNAGVGVGVNIDLSQAGSAFSSTLQSANDGINALVNATTSLGPGPTSDLHLPSFLRPKD